MHASRTIRNRPAVALAALLGLALTAAACGDDGAEPQVIRIGDAGGAGAEAATSAPMAAADSDAGLSSRLAAVQYTVIDGLPALDGDAAAWSFPAGTAADAGAVAELAAALGVEGDPVELGADRGGGWRVGPEDGSAASLWVSGDAMGSWWWNPASSDLGWATSTCVAEGVAGPVTTVPADVDGAAPEPSCVPEPPAGIPDAGAAEAMARELFGSWGIEADDVELEVYADDWSASVTGWRLFGGVRSDVTVSAGYGADGALTWASGTLAEPRREADYPRIGTAAAVERLIAQGTGGGWFAASPTMSARTDVAVDCAFVDPPAADDAREVVIADPATEEPATTVPGDAPADDVAVDPCTGTAVEPIVVELTGVRGQLQSLWDVDGTVWLLPAYGFETSDGGVVSVYAVPDELIATDTPTDVPASEPAVIDDPVPLPDTTPVPDTAPVETTVVETTVVAVEDSAGGDGASGSEGPGGSDATVGTAVPDAPVTTPAG